MIDEKPSDICYALRRDPGGTGQGHNTNYATGEFGVRRLTPVECERLQGFTDGWTIPSHEHWKYKDDPEWPLLPPKLDSARYRALGNAVTVSVSFWIAKRIKKYEESH